MAHSAEDFGDYDSKIPETSRMLEDGDLSFLNLAGGALEKVLLSIRAGAPIEQAEAA